MLVLDPMDRPTAQQCSNLKWLKMWKNRENNGTEKRLNPNVVKALVGFKEYSDMRKLLCEVLSFTLLPEQIEGLRGKSLNCMMWMVPGRFLLAL